MFSFFLLNLIHFNWRCFFMERWNQFSIAWHKCRKNGLCKKKIWFWGLPSKIFDSPARHLSANSGVMRQAELDFKNFISTLAEERTGASIWAMKSQNLGMSTSMSSAMVRRQSSPVRASSSCVSLIIPFIRRWDNSVPVWARAFSLLSITWDENIVSTNQISALTCVNQSEIRIDLC